MTYTHWILLVATVALAGFDVWAAFNSRKGDTLSEVIWTLAKRPIVPFVFGVIAGHLFWPKG